MRRIFPQGSTYFDPLSCASCLIFSLSRFAFGQLTVFAASPFFS